MGNHGQRAATEAPSPKPYDFDGMQMRGAVFLTSREFRALHPLGTWEECDEIVRAVVIAELRRLGALGGENGR